MTQAAEEEKQKFLSIVNDLISVKDDSGIYINCATQSRARTLRRRLYAIREALPEFDKAFADRITIKLEGNRLKLTRKGEWVQNVQSGASNDPISESITPPSDRLDNPG